jgi:heat-inducible transcriptional repressor
MADLEAMGYLEQPHTSAGRVPSSRGYRLFVNELMEKHKLSGAEMEAINASMRMKMQELDRLIAEAGQFLSALTQYTAYTLTPLAPAVCFVRFDLFPAGPDVFVIVAVTDTQAVKNKIVHPSVPPDETALGRLTWALNRHLVGPALRDINEALLLLVRRDAGPAGIYVDCVAAFLDELREEFDRREVYLTGQSHILGHPEYRDIIKARKLLEYLSDRREMARLTMPESGAPVQFLIGPENVAEQLRDTSVVMASYRMGDNLRGLIGVVGPTRMDYGKVAARLSYIASGLANMLAMGSLLGSGEIAGGDLDE